MLGCRIYGPTVAIRNNSVASVPLDHLNNDYCDKKRCYHSIVKLVDKMD